MKTLVRRMAVLALLGSCLFIFSGATPVSAATGTVKVTVKDCPSDYYYIYLFKTGDASPTASVRVFITAGKWVSFTGVTTGYRYFIRVLEDTNSGGDFGGQCPDGKLDGGTLWLSDLHCISGWQ
jgi:hypothetical protein